MLNVYKQIFRYKNFWNLTKNTSTWAHKAFEHNKAYKTYEDIKHAELRRERLSKQPRQAREHASTSGRKFVIT